MPEWSKPEMGVMHPNKRPGFLHIDYAPVPECEMFEFTYGEVCIKCNVCGRFKNMARPTAEQVRRELKGE
jgi:hypothetical protein